MRLFSPAASSQGLAGVIYVVLSAYSFEMPLACFRQKPHAMSQIPRGANGLDERSQKAKIELSRSAAWRSSALAFVPVALRRCACTQGHLPGLLPLSAHA